MRNIYKAFTLIELLIVILIVAILASVAVPIMQSAKKRAIATEAIAVLGTIRSAERLYFVEHGVYTSSLIDLGFKLRDGVPKGDLDGTYFSDDCYYKGYEIWVAFEEGIYYLAIFCCPYFSKEDGAPKAAEARKIAYNLFSYIAIDQDGSITTNIEGLGLTYGGG